MSERADGSDFFRLWMEANRSLWERAPGPGAGGAGGLGPGFGAPWQQALALHGEWARFWAAFTAADRDRRADPGASPFDPAGWLRGEGQGGMADLLRWLEGPGLSGPLARYGETLAGTREWLAYLAAVEQMKAVLGEGWLTAFRAFVEQASSPGAASDAPALEALWQRLADDRLARMQRSPAFLAASRDLVAAETAVRARLRREVEQVAEILGLPTRAEVDALAESVHALGRAERRARAAARRAGPSAARSRSQA